MLTFFANPWHIYEKDSLMFFEDEDILAILRPNVEVGSVWRS